MDQPVQTYILSEISQTIAFGACIGALLLPSDLVLLSGGLGAGKTHLTKGIAAGMGSSATVTSPTYVFINEYRLNQGGVVFHVDLYRIEDSNELASIGLDDALQGHGACIIEWPERDPLLMTLPHLAITLTVLTDHTRQVVLQGRGPRAAALLTEIRSRWQNGAYV